MAGSPVFKFKPSSSKKLKTHRKLSLPNVNENPPKQSHQLSVTDPKPNLSDKCAENKNEDSGIQDVTNRTEPNKSVSSSLSSFVFPSKKCAKRKLNFDVDTDNDDVSSLRFSDKNLSLCGFRSKTSSVTDQRSLPDIRNAAQSPNKNKTRFSGSYRSSVGSVISCRRKLFGDFEPALKKPKLTSPVLCQKTKSNKKEIKLSLKKKFPGVPNSDSARSGLLLNLAFSKYNLSSSKKEDVSVDFVDSASGCTATKKDFVHYSQIKQDDSTHCRSPVFMAIKKVKRKLNLEDQCSLVSNKSVESNADILNENESKDETPAIELVCEKPNVPKSDVDVEATNVSESNRQSHPPTTDPKPKSCALSVIADIIGERRDSKRHDTSTKAFTPFSPVITKQTGVSNDLSSKQKLNLAKCKNNLFKNSRIRSTLRDKIFDLSEANPNRDKNVCNESSNSHKSLMENPRCHNQIPKLDKSGNICERGASAKKNSSTNVIADSQEPNSTKLDPSKKVCKFRNVLQQKHSKKWINRDSFGQVPMNRQFKLGNSNSCDQRFLKSHMNRFLTDCLTFSGQQNESEYEDVFDNASKNNSDEIKGKRSNVIDDNPKELVDFTIENVDSQEELAKDTCDSVKSRLTVDKKICNDKRADFNFKIAESLKEFEKNSVEEIKTGQDKLIIDDETPNKEKTNFIIENINTQELSKKVRVKVKNKANQLIINNKISNEKQPESVIEDVDSREDITAEDCNKTKIIRNKWIIGEKTPENERTDFTIDIIDSQDDVVIENVDSQHEHEEVTIEPIESQNELIPATINPMETDVNLLLLESQQYTMSIGLKDCILKKSTPKVCKSVNTDVGTSLMVDEAVAQEITCANSQKDVFESCSDIIVSDSDMKIEQVSTSASYSCVQFTDKSDEKSSATPNCKNTTDFFDTLDTTKKTKKKSTASSLTYRLDRLLNREKSDFRMWEYEMSRTNVQSNPVGKPAVFCIEKMWKEYSHIILLCSYFYKDISAQESCEFNELKSFAKDVSNSIVIILEQDYCPKNLSYSSVFRVYPPWKLLNFEKCDPLVMLKPCKISIISNGENPILYKDPTIPNTFIVTRQRELCSCEDICCNCGLPDSYQFLIEPLLIPDLSFLSRKNSSYHHFDADTFNSRHINEVLIKHKLFAIQDLTLDVKVLHYHKDESIREFSFWYFVCLDEEKNLCCVLTETKIEEILPSVDKECMLKFSGISPCKLIPSRNVMIFLQYLNFTNIPDDVKKVIDSQSVVVFLLSSKYGNVDYVD